MSEKKVDPPSLAPCFCISLTPGTFHLHQQPNDKKSLLLSSETNPAVVSSCCSVTKSFPTLCDPIDMPGFPVLHYLLSSISRRELKLTSIVSTMPSNHLILGHPLLLLPPIFPSIRVLSSESALQIRWPNYWSFISVLPMNIQG